MVQCARRLHSPAAMACQSESLSRDPSFASSLCCKGLFNLLYASPVETNSPGKQITPYTGPQSIGVIRSPVPSTRAGIFSRKKLTSAPSSGASCLDWSDVIQPCCKAKISTAAALADPAPTPVPGGIRFVIWILSGAIASDDWLFSDSMAGPPPPFDSDVSVISDGIPGNAGSGPLNSEC